MKIKNPLFRLLATNYALGMLLGALLVAGLLVFDSGNIRTLALGDSNGIVAVFILLVAFSTMGGAILMGSAVMTHRSYDDPPRGGKRQRGGEPGLEPALARATAPRPRSRR